MTRSPLGKYSALVAAVVAVGIIGVYLFASLFGSSFGMAPNDLANLRDLAFIAVGAVLGSAATVNGVKDPIESAHARIDKIEVATGVHTHTELDPHPGTSVPG